MRKETGVKGGVTLFRGTGTAAYEYLESHPLDWDDYFLECGDRAGVDHRCVGEHLIDQPVSWMLMRRGRSGQVADQLVESRWGGDLILCNQSSSRWALGFKPDEATSWRPSALGAISSASRRSPAERSVGRQRYLRRAPGGSTGSDLAPRSELCLPDGPPVLFADEHRASSPPSDGQQWSSDP